MIDLRSLQRVISTVLEGNYPNSLKVGNQSKSSGNVMQNHLIIFHSWRESKSKAAFLKFLKCSHLGLITFSRFLQLYLVSQYDKYTLGTPIISVAHSHDVLPLLKPVKHCKGVSITLQALSKLPLKGGRGGALRGSL